LQTKNVPVLLERDNNIPPLSEIIEEYHQIKDIIQRAALQEK